jgi:hypothetical protein
MKIFRYTQLWFKTGFLRFSVTGHKQFEKILSTRVPIVRVGFIDVSFLSHNVTSLSYPYFLLTCFRSDNSQLFVPGRISEAECHSLPDALLIVISELHDCFLPEPYFKTEAILKLLSIPFSPLVDSLCSWKPNCLQGKISFCAPNGCRSQWTWVNTSNTAKRCLILRKKFLEAETNRRATLSSLVCDGILREKRDKFRK